jgi:hypothetical protein
VTPCMWEKLQRWYNWAGSWSCWVRHTIVKDISSIRWWQLLIMTMGSEKLVWSDMKSKTENALQRASEGNCQLPIITSGKLVAVAFAWHKKNETPADSVAVHLIMHTLYIFHCLCKCESITHCAY